jgi:radical SAM protein with 4Fe4S-binding SPASM domain
MFSAPNHVNFLLTHRCNMSCKYCYVPFTSFSDELTTEQVIQVIDLLYERGVFSLDLTGGEPLLRHDITCILEHCNELDMDVGLATNGVLLTRDRVKEIARVWKRKRTVHVSLDGSTPESYFQMTGSRGFFTILDGTKALLEEDLDVIWNFVYTPENREELLPICRLACEVGVSKMFVLPLINVGRAVRNHFSFEELQEFLIGYPQLQEEVPGIRFRVTPATPLDFLVPLLEAGWDMETIHEYFPYAKTPLQDQKFKEIRTIGCIAGVGRWAVNAQGDVFPCELLATNESMRCGNLLVDSFEDCVNACDSALDIEIGEIGQCASCKYAGICGGGCRARAFAGSGSLAAPDPFCPFQKSKEEYSPVKVKRYGKGKGREVGYRAFSVKIDSTVLRVRKESFGGTVYVPGQEKQIYVNEDGLVMFEILEKTENEDEIIEELKRRNLSADKESVHEFLEILYETLSG